MQCDTTVKNSVCVNTLTLIYMGEGGKFAPGSFFATAQKRLALETLWLLLLAYYTSFGILFGHQGPKLLPW